MFSSLFYIIEKYSYDIKNPTGDRTASERRMLPVAARRRRTFSLLKSLVKSG